MDHALLQFSGGGTLVPAVHAVVEAGDDELRADGLREDRGVEVRHVVDGPCAQQVREYDLLRILQNGLEPSSVLGEESEFVHLPPELQRLDSGERAPVGERAEDGFQGLADHLLESLLHILRLG